MKQSIYCLIILTASMLAGYDANAQHGTRVQQEVNCDCNRYPAGYPEGSECYVYCESILVSNYKLLLQANRRDFESIFNNQEKANKLYNQFSQFKRHNENLSISRFISTLSPALEKYFLKQTANFSPLEVNYLKERNETINSLSE